MNIRNLLSVFGVLTALVAVSCTSDKEFTPDVGEQVEAIFSAGISTRVSDVLWDPYDAIGITMVDRTTGAIVGGMSNVRYCTTTSAGNFLPTTNAVYFPQDGSEVTFKSYYPYSASVGTDMKIPVSVASQTNLPEIDFMTAEHLSGFNKNTQNVSLRFHHRLSKVIFRLYNGDNQVDLQPGDLSVLIEGMKTTGTYDVFTETLTVNEDSVADIAIPRGSSASERTGIVLPRAAGPGVTFQLSHANGSMFTAEMDEELDLLPGYKYIFNITYTGNELTISVTIEDWIEGPTTSYDILGITTPAGDSYGVVDGDQLKVYIQNGNQYEDLTSFICNENTGRWTAVNPVYWDDIDDTEGSINLRGALVPRQPAANSTQMEDLIIADPLNVVRNTGADFVLRHAGSLVRVTVMSDVLSSSDLAAGTITLPDYFYGGYEELGVFIEGTERQDILVDRTDPADQFAIIQPQSVSPGANLVTVTVNGKDYTAKADASEGFLFEPGTAYELIITINESDVSVSARVIDWAPSGPHYFEVLQVSSSGETEGVDVGTQMSVYRLSGSSYVLWADYLYMGGNIWTPDRDIYWSDVPGDAADIRATIVAAEALNNTQMDDYLVADPLHVPAYRSADFVFRHVGSKVTVKVVSEVFDNDMLADAVIVMPDYRTGGSLAAGTFVPGTTTDDIRLVRDDASQEEGLYNQVAIFQPQTVAAGEDMFVVTIAGTDYHAKAPAGTGFEYQAGINYAIVISVNEDVVTVSATVIDWETETYNLNAFTVDTRLPDGSSGVEDGARMEVYYGSENARTLLTTFTYMQGTDTWTPDANQYWEELVDIFPTTFYAGILNQARPNDTQLDDYLIAAPIDADFGDPLNFRLTHPAARVEIELVSEDGTFTKAELQAMEMQLINYMTGGDYNDGVFEWPSTNTFGDIDVEKVDSSAIAIIRPQSIVPEQPVVRITDPATGRVYNVLNNSSVSNIDFRAGYITILRINMEKTEIRISATIEPWVTQEPVELTPTPITIEGNLGATADFFKDKTIRVYKMGSDFKEITYSYIPASSGSTDYVWMGNETMYWEDVVGQTLNLRAAYYPGTIPTVTSTTTSINGDLPRDQSNGFELYDILMARYSSAVPQYVALPFTHIYSKVRIELITDPGEFSADELLGAQITLNGFIMDGTISLETATANPTVNNRGDITPWTETEGRVYSALVQPQTIPAGTTIVTVKLRDVNVPFAGQFDEPFVCGAGDENVIRVRLSKTQIQLSATLEEWSEGSSGEIEIQ